MNDPNPVPTTAPRRASRLAVIAGTVFVVTAAMPYAIMLVRGKPPEPAGGERLLVLSPHRREVRLEYDRAFSAHMLKTANRKVRIEWLDVGGTSKMIKDLETRFQVSSNVPGVDILFGGGVSPYLHASAMGWLAPLDITPGNLTAIPDTVAGNPVRDPSGRWHGVAISGFGILYNKPIVQRLRLPEPKDWRDIAQPAYFSWVGSGDPRSSGSVHMCYEIILQACGYEEGWRVITRICANVRSFGESGGTVPREVAAGDIAAGMVIDQYAQTVIDAVGNDLLVFVLPQQATMVGPDPIAIIRGAPQPELAGMFVNYVLSEQGQRVLFQPAGTDGQMKSLHRAPVREPLYADPHAPRVNPYLMKPGFKFDNARDDRRRRILDDMMGVWLIDAHPDLVKAWNRIRNSGVDSRAAIELTAPPVSEDELMKLAVEWKDPRKRQEIMTRWASQAQERYRKIAGQREDPPAL